MKLRRVNALPVGEALEPNALYLIASGDALSIAVTGNDKSVIKNTEDVATVLDEALQTAGLDKLVVDAQGVLKVSTVPVVRTGVAGNADAVVKNVILGKAAHLYSDNAASYAFNFANGSCQRFAPTEDGTLSFTGFTADQLCEILIEGVDLGARTLTFPVGINWLKSDGSFTSSFAETGVTLNASGIDFILFWTRDAGATLYAKVFR